jgi:hypothetical protein
MFGELWSCLLVWCFGKDGIIVELLAVHLVVSVRDVSTWELQSLYSEVRGSLSWGEGIELHTVFTTWQENDLFDLRRLVWWLAIRRLRPLRGSRYYRATGVSVTNYIAENHNSYLEPYGSWRFGSRIAVRLFCEMRSCLEVWVFCTVRDYFRWCTWTRMWEVLE